MEQIWIDEQNGEVVFSTLGNIAAKVRKQHEARLREIWDTGLKQANLNRVFNQTGLNTYFVMDQGGDVRAAGSEEHCLNYMQDGYVLIERKIPKETE